MKAKILLLLFLPVFAFAQDYTLEQLYCTDYFSPVFTELIPQYRSECTRKPRKTFFFRGYQRDFLYKASIEQIGLSPDSLALHFVSEPQTPETEFIGYVSAHQDSFEYQFSTGYRARNDKDHYFFFPSDFPSLLKVSVVYRRSVSNRHKVLSTSFKTQFFQNCEVVELMNELLENVDCPEPTDFCNPIVSYEENPHQDLPNLSTEWLEECPTFFEPLWHQVFTYNEELCQLIQRGFSTKFSDDSYTVSFPLDHPSVVHHLYASNSDLLNDLVPEWKHKRSDLYEDRFIYTIRSQSDKKRKHLFYTVDSIPSLLVLETIPLENNRIKYQYTKYVFCDVMPIQRELVEGLTGYCPDDKNPCHSFEINSNSDTDALSALRSYKSKSKIIYIKDRTCNTAVSDEALSIMIPKTVLANCSETGHVFISPKGEFLHQFTYFMNDFIVMAFKGRKDWMDNENLLASKIIIAP
ncbi:MAG: hypothetical protein AAF849_04920 [Bacteroidota bacterium]